MSLDWRPNAVDATFNMQNTNNIYVIEKNGHIDRIVQTDWPKLTSIKHYFASIIYNTFTDSDYKYFSGKEAFTELRKIKEVEYDIKIDEKSSPEKRSFLLHVHQVDNLKVFADQFEKALDAFDEEAEPETNLDSQPFQKSGKNLMPEEVPETTKPISTTNFKSKPAEIKQGLNKFPSEDNPEIRAQVNAPSQPVKTEPLIQQPIINQTLKDVDDKPKEEVENQPEEEDKSPRGDLHPELREEHLKAEKESAQATEGQTIATPAQKDETTERIELAKNFIKESLEVVGEEPFVNSSKKVQWEEQMRGILEDLLDNPRLEPEDIKFYLGKLGIDKNDEELKGMMEKHGYQLSLVTYSGDNKATLFSEEYLPISKLEDYSLGKEKFDPNKESIFA